jgi:hypothetical protein
MEIGACSTLDPSTSLPRRKVALALARLKFYDGRYQRWCVRAHDLLEAGVAPVDVTRLGWEADPLSDILSDPGRGF